MPETLKDGPSFNLWHEPWLALEHGAGDVHHLGIEQALLRAHNYAAIYEPSPLVVVGIHRLLTAILQAAYHPRRPPDLQELWRAGRFPEQPLVEFAQRYAGRFDLFAADVPFLQSADLPLRPAKGDKTKTVAYLAPEIPAGTEITHYRHGVENDHVFCPACAAGGLVAIPAFATSGGAGIKPSINGVPPVYVLPGGCSLFESLARSLVLPNHQPAARSRSSDLAWWQREAVVRRGQETVEVGYLHSLTFAARRVRLHPERLNVPCTRCGANADWGVRTMVFEMGECRPAGAPTWFDPFVAYRLPTGKGKMVPVPIRPRPGQALWREFATLFLLCSPKQEKNTTAATMRPAVVHQMAITLPDDTDRYAFRCVGLRTDMKAKVFEWVESGFDVPPALLRDPAGGDIVLEAVRFADECAAVIRGVFRTCFGGQARKSERHRVLRERMQDEFWAALAEPFRQMVLQIATPQERDAARRQWFETAVHKASVAFRTAAAAVGEDAASLRQRVEGEIRADIRLRKKQKEYTRDE